MGIYDKSVDGYKTIAKIGTGLSDEQWIDLKKMCTGIRVKTQPHNFDVPKGLECDVWVVPKIVVSIRADQITKSPIHTAGYALRFPRLMGYRKDISTEDITEIKEIEKLFSMQ